MDTISNLPEETPYRVSVLVDVAKLLTPEGVSSFGEVVSKSGIGSLRIKAVKDLKPEDIAYLSDVAKRALNFSNSVIVDAGIGIGALIDAIPREEQEFLTSDVNKALLDAGLIAEGTMAKMGPSAAVVEGNRGSEVIENTVFETKGGVTGVMSKTKVAWSDGEKLRVSDLEDDRRVVLENEFLVEERDVGESNALALQIDIERGDVDLYQLIADAAKMAGFEDYALGCVIEGPIKAEMAVLKELPEKRIETMEEMNNVLVTYKMETDSTFYFTGSRSAQVSRQNRRWEQITGDSVYSPDGHYHGYSVDGEVAGHIRSIKPQKGSKVMMILESARVVQVVGK